MLEFPALLEESAILVFYLTLALARTFLFEPYVGGGTSIELASFGILYTHI